MKQSQQATEQKLQAESSQCPDVKTPDWRSRGMVALKVFSTNFVPWFMLLATIYLAILSVTELALRDRLNIEIE
jgi:hypothetical protein